MKCELLQNRFQYSRSIAEFVGKLFCTYIIIYLCICF